MLEIFTEEEVERIEIEAMRQGLYLQDIIDFLEDSDTLTVFFKNGRHITIPLL